MKKIITLLGFLSLAGAALAEPTVPLPASPPDLSYQPAEPVLDMQDREALDLSRKAAQENRYPVQDGDKTLYLYGSGQATLICAPLKLCVVELQDGETVQPNGIHLGDAVRWKATPTVGDGKKTFIILKPVTPRLETNMVVVTDKHSYDIRLVSQPNAQISKIGWNYPADTMDAWKAYHQAADAAKAQELAAKAQELAAKQAEQRAQQAAQQVARERQKEIQDRQNALLAKQQEQQKERETLPATRDVLSALDFNYTVSGCEGCSWRPVRVYNNGQQTIVELPDLTGKEAPALLVMNGSSEALVNYRVLNNYRYVVDKLFQQAVLIMGVGEQQQRVVISRGGAS